MASNMSIENENVIILLCTARATLQRVLRVAMRYVLHLRSRFLFFINLV